MQTETALAGPTIYAWRHSILNRLGRHRWLLGSLAVALLAGGFAWQWSWLVAIGVAPLLISAAPCLVMCALGLCMHRVGNPAGNPVQDVSAAPLTSDNPSPQQES
jgi:hypothetical protein